jgi:pectate lyase
MYNIYAYILQKNNIFDNTTGTKDGTASGVILGERYITTDPYTLKKDPEKITSLPYKYTLDNAKDVPAIVQREAGPHNLK